MREDFADCLPLMAAQVNLQPERASGRSPNIAQGQLFIDKMKVIMQALAVGGPQEGSAGLLMAPSPVGGTRFHGREDAHQTGVGASLFENLFHPILFVEFSLAKEDELQALLGGESFGIVSRGVTHRLGEPRIIKNPDLVGTQVRGHVFGVTEPWQCSLDRAAGETGKDAADLVGRSLRKQFHEACSSPEMENIIKKSCHALAID